MSVFGREFAVDCLSDAVLEENGWMRDLLSHWHPSGDALTRRTGTDDPLGLRLAIRNGYLNFYRHGQSVARVSFDRHGKLQAHVHNKYVYCDEVNEQSYVVVTAAGFPATRGGPQSPYNDRDYLPKWIRKADCYAGVEKRFVDRIVAHNPDVIDLEMGLPAFSLDPAERVAPRMDLVALERSAKGWRVVFWEAKLVEDGRARRAGDAMPEVVRQLNSYSNWLAYGDHQEAVAKAYWRTCRLLVQLHTIAQHFRAGIEDLGPGIREVARLDPASLLIDDRPRLLIDDWDEEANCSRDKTFTEHKHLQKLRDKAELTVQMVQRSDQFTLGMPS